MWKKILKIIKNPIFIFSLIFILGLVLRLLEIGRTSFWYDEAFTGDTIKLSWQNMFQVIAEDKVHPPLFYILIRLWSDLFGLTQYSLRGFSIFWGVALIFAVFFGIRNIFEKGKFPIVSLLSSFAVAISPFFISYSNEARSYSFLAFIAFSLSISIIKWLDSDNRREGIKYLLISILLAILLCGTHYLQIIFVIALVCSILVYKFVFTSKGVNKRNLFIGIGLVFVGILAVVISPIKSILASHGLTGMWWVPDIKWYEVFRVYYAYFLGVVRYMDGVPPMRDLIVNIPYMVIAYALFAIHTISLVWILISKKFDLTIKRRIVFYYVLGIVTFIGFFTLSAIGFHSFVERYTIAGGVILFVSFWITIGTVLDKWFVVIPPVIYVVFTFLLTSMPLRIDYRPVAEKLDNLNDVERYVFTSPTDLIDSEFYMSHTNVYYSYDFKGEYPGWALLHDDINGVDINSIEEGDILITPTNDVSKYLNLGFKIDSILDDNFTLLKK